MTDFSSDSVEKEPDDCCNSGCNNCILDMRQKQSNRSKAFDIQKNNLFDGTYRRFCLIEIEICTENVRRYRFRFMDDESVMDLSAHTIKVPPTHFLILRAPSKAVNSSKYDKNTVNDYISRPYTPIRCDSNQLTFDILVKLEPNGSMSEYLRTLQVNNLTEWKGVYGHFCWTPNPNMFKYLVCICQGVAIAPHFSLIMSILCCEEDETRVYLLACFKNIANCLLRNELVACHRYWNFKAIFYMSQANRCDRCSEKKLVNCVCLKSQLRFGETIRSQRLDHAELTNFYRTLNSNYIFTLFCGTNALERIVKTSLDELTDVSIKENYFRLE